MRISFDCEVIRLSSNLSGGGEPRVGPQRLSEQPQVGLCATPPSVQRGHRPRHRERLPSHQSARQGQVSAPSCSLISTARLSLSPLFGSFGKVYLVRPQSGGPHEVYAMKVLRKQEVIKRHQVEHTLTERVWIHTPIHIIYIPFYCNANQYP